MEEALKAAIEQIIRSIPSGCVFDSHTVIWYLLQKHSDPLLGSYTGDGTALYFGHIGQVIASFEGDGLIDRVGESWSKNIHDEFSACAYWRKK